MTAARATIGPTLQAAFLPMFVAPLLAAYLPETRSLLRQSIVISVLAFAATVPLFGIAPPGPWLQLLALTFACTAFVWAAASAIVRLGPHAAFAQTLVLLAWMAWMTWPVWLGPLWPHASAAPWLNRLLPFNPVAAIGGAMIDLGDWTHQPIAYKYLVNLGQDVPYEPPTSAWPAIVAHGVAAILLSLSLGERLGEGPERKKT